MFFQIYDTNYFLQAFASIFIYQKYHSMKCLESLVILSQTILQIFQQDMNKIINVFIPLVNKCQLCICRKPYKMITK
ncbi:hypothetical protein pb186bvf_012650 [Paramecium bursaria]